MPPGLMDDGENALATVGEVAVTVRVAVFDTGPVAACVLETPEVVFGLTPTEVPRTTTVTVHESDAGMVRPVKESAVCPAAKLLPPAPAQLPPAAPAALMDIPESASVKAALVSAKLLELTIVKVIVLVVPSAIDAGVKTLLMVGDPATASEAEAAAPGGAWLLVAVPVVLLTVELVVTVCVMVHEPPDARVPVLNPTFAPPLTPPMSVATPPAVQETLPAAALVRPAG